MRPLPVVLRLGAVACASLGRRASLAYMSVAAELAPERVRIQIRRDFLERYKNRVTIDTRFMVDAVAGSPNPAAFDGDLHFAGRAPEIGFRLVGEIKNAADADSAVALIRRAARLQRPLAISGAWRIWPEHSLGAREEQDQPLRPLESPYPDHVFEVHPVTRVEGRSLLSTFKVLEGYKPGSAEKTLESYQEARCNLLSAGDRVTFETSSWLYNDVHFIMEIAEAEHLVAPDGRFVIARALDRDDGKVLVPNLRMVFVAGSEPERVVRGKRAGDRLHVWGLPRLDLSEMSRRMAEGPVGAAPLPGSLPYEIVVIGIYP